MKNAKKEKQKKEKVKKEKKKEQKQKKAVKEKETEEKKSEKMHKAVKKDGCQEKGHEGYIQEVPKVHLQITVQLKLSLRNLLQEVTKQCTVGRTKNIQILQAPSFKQGRLINRQLRFSY